MQTPASQSAELNLNQIHQRKHQEDASKHRPRRRHQDSCPECRRVNMDSHGDTAHLTTALANPDGLLESKGNEAGEEEGAEGVDVEGDEILAHGRVGDAGRLGDAREGDGRVSDWVPSEAEEDGEGEE